MERKKSKHAVSFPTSLDMGRFVSAASVDASAEGNTESNIFELRGVLLHKGPSAYHGHYEAQVFEAT
jgi:ubiquitin carboxyl-terminal hydrolase 48